jgi:hypothetical protein
MYGAVNGLTPQIAILSTCKEESWSTDGNRPTWRSGCASKRRSMQVTAGRMPSSLAGCMPPLPRRLKT